MGTIFNSKVFKGVSIAGKIMKGMVKNGVVFWQTLPTDYILAYDFNGNTTDSSVNGLNGAMTGTLAFDTGRKIGTQSLKFTEGCVVTILPIPLNSDKVSISFWIKTRQASLGMIMELSSRSNHLNAFYLANYELFSMSTPQQTALSNIKTDGIWRHYIFSANRSNGQMTVTENGVSIIVPNSALIGNFINDILFIGQRGASSLPFVGNLQDLKIYNRVLSEDEITALYNE